MTCSWGPWCGEKVNHRRLVWSWYLFLLFNFANVVFVIVSLTREPRAPTDDHICSGYYTCVGKPQCTICHRITSDGCEAILSPGTWAITFGISISLMQLFIVLCSIPAAYAKVATSELNFDGVLNILHTATDPTEYRHHCLKACGACFLFLVQLAVMVYQIVELVTISQTISSKDMTCYTEWVNPSYSIATWEKFKLIFMACITLSLSIKSVLTIFAHCCCKKKADNPPVELTNINETAHEPPTLIQSTAGASDLIQLP